MTDSIKLSSSPLPRLSSRVPVLLPASLAVAGVLGGWLLGASSAPGFHTVRYFDRWTQYPTALVSNADGSIDEVLAGTGHGSQLGGYSVVTTAHLAPDGFDVATFSLIYAVTGETASTTVKGETLTTSFVGVLRVPVDAGFNPLPSPRPFSVTWTATGGTGRFEGATGTGTFSGEGLADGTFAGSSIGELTLMNAVPKSARPPAR